jgi:hypothetical protein
VALHIVVASAVSGLWHTTRDSTGWTRWAPLPPVPAPIVRMSAATVGAELHVCAVTATTGALLHTFFAAGAWQPLWGDVGDVAGLPTAKFEFHEVGLAGRGTTLQVCATMSQRPGIVVRPVVYATRSTGGGAIWTSPFTEVNGGQFSGTATTFRDPTPTNVGGTVHMCNLGINDNRLWHTIQLGPPPNESWQPYNDVKPVLNNSPAQIGIVSIAGVGPNLHVCGVSGGSVIHTIRMSSPPSWQNPEGSQNPVWGDVTAAVPGLSGTPNFIGCAAVDGNLHLCCLTTGRELFHTIRLSNPPSWRNPENATTPMWGNVGAVVGRLGPDPAPFGLFAVAGD